MDEKNKSFGNWINHLIEGKNLSRKQTGQMMSEILKGDQSEIHQGAFLAAITAKGPTPDEIAGTWDAIYNHDTVKVKPDVAQPVIDNCGTGMDSFKTFNISTAAAIVAAAGGVRLARHGARAITSRCGTVDLCKALGVDVECPAEIIKSSIEKTGIGLFNGMSHHVHPNALFRILSRMSFGSILNIAASLANPALPRYGVRGVYDKKMIFPVINTMKEIGFKKAMVFYGESGNGKRGMDELSPLAKSYIAELDEDGKITDYTILPEALGLDNSFNLDEISGGNNPESEALRLLKVLTGINKKELYETICLNTAPIFYIAGLAKNLKHGIEKARNIIDSGAALEKLKQWVTTQNRQPERGCMHLDNLINAMM